MKAVMLNYRMIYKYLYQKSFEICLNTKQIQVKNKLFVSSNSYMRKIKNMKKERLYNPFNYLYISIITTV